MLQTRHLYNPHILLEENMPLPPPLLTLLIAFLPFPPLEINLRLILIWGMWLMGNVYI